MSASKPKTPNDGSTKTFVRFPKSLTDCQPHLTELGGFEILSRPDLLILITDDYATMEKKFIDFAVHTGFPSHHAASIFNQGTPQFFYHSLLGKMGDDTYQVDRDFTLLMAEGLKNIDPSGRLLAEVQKWSVSREPWENPNAVPDTYRFVFKKAVDGVAAEGGNPAIPAIPAVFATETTSVANWLIHMADFFNHHADNVLDNLVGAPIIKQGLYAACVRLAAKSTPLPAKNTGYTDDLAQEDTDYLHNPLICNAQIRPMLAISLTA